MRLSLSILCCFVLGSQAQVGPQASQLPACIKDCDPAAIISVNCTNADQYCHCMRQTGIISNITICAQKVCDSPSTSLYTFTTLFGQVCAPFNISVPVIGSNATPSVSAAITSKTSLATAIYSGGIAGPTSKCHVGSTVLGLSLLLYGII